MKKMNNFKTILYSFLTLGLVANSCLTEAFSQACNANLFDIPLRRNANNVNELEFQFRGQNQTFNWQFKNSETGGFVNISSLDTNFYKFEFVPDMVNDIFRVRATDPDCTYNGQYRIEVIGTCFSDTVTIDDFGIGDNITFVPEPESYDLVATCANPTITLKVLIDGEENNTDYEYLWSNDATTSSIELTPTGNATYYVTVTNPDFENCEKVDSFKVTFDKRLPINVNAGDDQSLEGCDDRAVLEGSATSGDNSGINYSWETPSGKILLGQDHYNQQEIGEYILTAENKKNGCKATDKVNITGSVDNTAHAEINTEGDITELTCSNDEIVLKTDNSSGQEPLAFTWEKLQEDGDTETVTEVVVDSARYILTVKDGNNCRAKDTIHITADFSEPTIQIDEISTSIYLCQDSAAMLCLTGNSDINSDVTLLWTINDINSGSESCIPINTASKTSQPDIYQITGTKISNGCPASDQVAVNINEVPIFLEIKYPKSIRSGTEFEFETVKTSVNNAIISFDIGQVGNIDEESSDLNGNDEKYKFIVDNPDRARGTVLFKITATAGCATDTTVAVNVQQDPLENIFFPEIFTPNGDGVNDVWNVTFPNDGDYEKYNIKVFNRGGGLVYQSDNMIEGFSGDGCSDGYYVVIITDNSTKDVLIKKGITMIGKQ